MSKGPMITDGRAQPTGARHQKCGQKNRPSRQREKYETDQRQNMNGNDKDQELKVCPIRFPPRQRPRVLFT
jgi:hypothetical protein